MLLKLVRVRSTANATIAIQLGYAFRNWLIFFVNNSLIKPYESFYKRKCCLKLSLCMLEGIS